MSKSPTPRAAAPKAPADPVVNDLELGELIGIADRNVRELVRQGVLTKRAGENAYPMRASVAAYCAWLRERAAGRGTGQTAEHKARLVKEQADRVALDNQAKRGELVPAREVEAVWTGAMAALRGRMLAVPTRCRQRAGHLTLADVSVIDREIRDALTELAGGGEPLENSSEGL